MAKYSVHGTLQFGQYFLLNLISNIIIVDGLVFFQFFGCIFITNPTVNTIKKHIWKLICRQNVDFNVSLKC